MLYAAHASHLLSVCFMYVELTQHEEATVQRFDDLGLQHSE